MTEILKNIAGKVVLFMVLPFLLSSCDVAGDTTLNATPPPVHRPARRFVDSVTVGINIGNTLDAGGGKGLDTETSWGNPRINEALIQSIADIGMNVVRLPVSWDKHVGIYPDYAIDADWLDRVEEVVKLCLDKGLYVILNTQHEDRLLLPSIAKEDYETAKNYITAIWTQLSARFKDYPERLVFNVMNEPRSLGTDKEWSGGTPKSREIVYKLNADALDVIRNSGGGNGTRVVMLPTYAASVWYSNDFTMPEDDDNVVVSVHSYEPYDFALNRQGTDKFDPDNNNLKDLFNIIDKNFLSKNILVVMDETGAMNKDGNIEQRISWAESYAAIAAEHGVPCLLWDNGVVDVSQGESFGLIDRNTAEWIYPEIVKAFIDAYEK